MTMPVPTSDDPLDEVLRPPPDETPEQRELRLAREEEAAKISQAIDASIKAEKQARKKKRIVRLLLLGQSESGKSTTLRQFQRLYTPTAFREERILWRAVIQLNIVRSIRVILETLTSPTQKSPKSSPFSSPRLRARSTSRPPALPSHIPPLPPSDYSHHNGYQNGHSNGNGNGYNEDSHSGRMRVDAGEDSDPESDSDAQASRSNPSSTTLIPSPLEALKTRLQPLLHIESLLIAKLVPPNEDEATHLAGPGPSHSRYPPGQPVFTTASSFRNQEIFVRPGAGWKGALSKARVNGSESSSPPSEPSRPTSAGNTGLETPDEPQEVLYQCRKDIMMLWNDDVVREILRRKKVRLEELPGFFLNDLERVTSLRYMPTDDDVLKARLKTVGVSEYKFEMEVSAGRDSGTEWRIVDVGGSRSQRRTSTWAPFFDDVDAIIFLAPISGFDQVLAEDRSVNRLEDSVLLWKAVCSNKLLANVDLVLFLNKCDILDAKLKSGIKLARYVKSYGDRENDLDSVSKYLRGKFSAIHREYSPHPRKFYAFCTSVTDTATTAGIIASVRDMVIRQHLKQSKLL
ncbi:putative G protein alpha subunit [Lyophyllum shimeji]|uniref:G protein alpha subunit n=1 Tax=Lyophyllum shimeji TaxID=47721 RepID=A0A9P3UMZ6_LYOSH|nr:putative G protein alpha subunit [Lyophyllum shimeji]